MDDRHAGKEEGIEYFQKFSDLLNAEILSIDTKCQNRQHIIVDDPKTSVMGSDNRTYDPPNLWIAGTSVIPLASCMNPTLAGATLSLR